MQGSQMREVALVVGVATAGVLTVALIVIGPTVADDRRYPQVTQLITPTPPQP
jgi:hypothetical protein